MSYSGSEDEIPERTSRSNPDDDNVMVKEKSSKNSTIPTSHSDSEDTPLKTSYSDAEDDLMMADKDSNNSKAENSGETANRNVVRKNKVGEQIDVADLNNRQNDNF